MEALHIQSKANVTSLGADLLGQHVACDAYDENRSIRVVTHAHADHMVGLGKSLKNSEVTIMTPATKDMIDALKGPRFLSRGIVETLDYGEEFTYGDETLTLHYADHILGTAQALVEDKEQTRILYTSDFRYSRTQGVRSKADQSRDSAECIGQGAWSIMQRALRAELNAENLE